MPKISRHGGPTFEPGVEPDEVDNNPETTPDTHEDDGDLTSETEDATPPGENPESNEDDEPKLAAPKRNASKPEWVKFAESKGVANADSYTRDQLADWWDDQQQS